MLLPWRRSSLWCLPSPNSSSSWQLYLRDWTPSSKSRCAPVPCKCLSLLSLRMHESCSVQILAMAFLCYYTVFLRNDVPVPVKAEVAHTAMQASWEQAVHVSQCLLLQSTATFEPCACIKCTKPSMQQPFVACHKSSTQLLLEHMLNNAGGVEGDMCLLLP